MRGQPSRQADRLHHVGRKLSRSTQTVDPLGLLGFGLLVGVWYAATLLVPRVLLPLPQDVVHRLYTDFSLSPILAATGVGASGLGANMLYTAQNVLVAVALGSAIGVGVGLVSARVELFRAVLDPIVLIGGTIPILVAAPFFLIWFGPTRTSSIALVTIYTMFIVIVYAQRATDNLDPVFERSALTLGAGRAHIIRDVLVPGTLPEIMGGVRIAFAGAWGLEAIAELLGLPKGIGNAVKELGTASDAEGILAAILLLGVIGVVLDAALVAVMSRVFRWRAT